MTDLNDETWNTCPDCDEEWEDDDPTPGVVHKTRLCEDCASEDAFLRGVPHEQFDYENDYPGEPDDGDPRD